MFKNVLINRNEQVNFFRPRTRRKRPRSLVYAKFKLGNSRLFVHVPRHFKTCESTNSKTAPAMTHSGVFTDPVEPLKKLNSSLVNKNYTNKSSSSKRHKCRCGHSCKRNFLDLVRKDLNECVRV